MTVTCDLCKSRTEAVTDFHVEEYRDDGWGVENDISVCEEHKQMIENGGIS